MNSLRTNLFLRLWCAVCIALAAALPAQAAPTIRFYAIVAAGGSIERVVA